MHWLLPLSLLIVFEIVADILSKEWSVGKPIYFAIGAILAYVIANTFWLFALKYGSGLAKGAIIFSVASAILATVIGVLLYKEEVTRLQLVGMVLGILSIFFLFAGEK